MPGKLYTDELAKLKNEATDKKYRPSNGAEGEMFYDLWCNQCKKERHCTIKSDAFWCNIDDKQYPAEWTHDSDGQPCCTAFGVED